MVRLSEEEEGRAKTASCSMCATVACHGQSSPQLLSQTRHLRSSDMRDPRETA